MSSPSSGLPPDEAEEARLQEASHGLAPLTDRQRLFCHEYVVDMNGTQAAIRAGYSRGSAEMQACRLLRNARVRHEVRRLQEQVLEEVEVRAGTILRELLRLATLDAADAFGPNGQLLPLEQMPPDVRRCIASLEVVEQTDSDGQPAGLLKKVKFWSKEKALEALAKHKGLLVDRVQVGAEASLVDLVARAAAQGKGET